MTRFVDLVATSAAVGATSSRREKVAALAELLARLPVDEVEVAVGFLVGAARQGRVGVGWAGASTIAGTATEPSLTLLELDAALGELAALSGPGSHAARASLLGRLGAAMVPDEADYLRRLLTGELRHGAAAGVMIDAVARAAGVAGVAVRRAAMLSGDLGATARLALAGGADALSTVRLAIGVGVEPMLASTATDVADALASTGRASVEWKLDGVRVQAHRVGDDVRLFTRNLNDVTERLPAVVDLLRSLPVERIVLDGELLGVDDDGAPQAFQDSAAAFSGESADRARLRIGFFDVLHVDGEDLLDRTLAERRAVMASIDRLPRIPATATDDPAVAGRVLDDALAMGHEGVMVKDLSSQYMAGRRGAAWRKVKPVHTLDLVVLAVEWGSGRRRGWLSNLHLGALDDSGAPVMVGKTFKGMTDEVLAWQTERFLELETHREGHVVHVRPEQVVEIALDAAQVSTRYQGGVALRFARVRRYRPDKSAAEADTLDAVRALLPRSRR